MLRFERRVTAALTGTTDPARRAAVEDFVDGTLATMPEILRGGVVLGSIGLATLATVVPIDRLSTLPIGPVQQYFRLFRSLVAFAEHETSPEPSV